MTFFFSSLGAIALLLFLLNNCVEDGKIPVNGNSQGGSPGSYGFHPDDIRGDTYDSNSSWGFSNEGSGRGERESENNGNESGSSDSPRRSSTVRNLEGRYGTSAVMEIEDRDVFLDFRFGVPVNNWDDIRSLRIYVDLQNRGDYNSGKVTIAYYDAGFRKTKIVSFDSGRSEGDIRYNVWFNASGKNVFHGFFQDSKGALILVIDRVTRVVGDPDSSENRQDYYGGSVWIMNFRTTFKGRNSCNTEQKYVFQYNQDIPGNCFQMFGHFQCERIPEPRKKCWRMDKGPYDCRTWRRGNGVHTHQAVEPDGHCYEKMATFEGLYIPDAFHINTTEELFR